jgi:hypothetical protein
VVDHSLGNHYIVFDTSKEVPLGKIATADYEIKGKLLDLSGEKRDELDKLIADQKLRNWAVVEKAQLVIYGMQAADVTVMVQNMLDSGKHVPHREVDRTARWASRD